MRLSIRIAIESGRPEQMGIPQFLPVRVATGPRAPFWVASLALHAAALFLFGQALPIITATDIRATRPLVVRFTGKIFYFKPLRRNEVLVLGDLRSTGGADNGAADLKRPVMLSGRTGAAPRREAVVRYHEPPVNAAVQSSVPSIAVWTQEIPKPPLKSFVEPGSRRAAQSGPQLLSAPEMHSPDPWQSPGAATGALRVLAMGSQVVLDPKEVILPPANASAASTRAGSGAQQDSNDAGHGVQGGGAALFIPAPPSTAPAMVTIRRPASGNFDAVIIQPSGADVVEGSSSYLEGKPVYTVYISVGTRKDWILQYCLPPDAVKQDDSGPVVKLTTAPAVSAPWPTLMIRPPISLPPGEKYMLVRGFLNAAGRCERLKIVRDGSAVTNDAVLHVLQNWEFRPAKSASTPVGVEFVLAIPSDIA